MMYISWISRWHRMTIFKWFRLYYYIHILKYHQKQSATSSSKKFNNDLNNNVKSINRKKIRKIIYDFVNFSFLIAYTIKNIKI